VTTATAHPVRHVEHCMGTVFSIDVRAPGVAASAIDNVVAWLHHVDGVFSTYRPDSIVSELARGSVTLSECPAEVREVIQRCDEISIETDGYFSARTRGVLDPSGYVKGWAVERASDILSAAGSVNHCINGGGDVQCVGSAAPDRPWHVGIAHPLRPGVYAARVQGTGRLAVATSGSAERGAHITDPRTGEGPVALCSVTVIGSGLADVDAYATAAFAMGDGAEAWLAARADLNWLTIDRDGRQVRP
jgi:FAD:protein FMN transferase